jgi:hypothetical protein
MVTVEWADGDVLRVLSLTLHTSIGRAVGSAIRLDNPVVSGTHARIDFDGRVSTITNVSKSDKPLWVGETEYHKDAVVVLGDEDTIRLPRFIDGAYDYYYLTYRAPWHLTGRFSTPYVGAGMWMHAPEEMLSGGSATRFRADMAVPVQGGAAGPAEGGLKRGGAAQDSRRAQKPRSTGWIKLYTNKSEGGGVTRKHRYRTPDQIAATAEKEKQKQLMIEQARKRRADFMSKQRSDSDEMAALHPARPPQKIASERDPFTGRPIFTLVDDSLPGDTFEMTLPDGMEPGDARVTIQAMLSSYQVGDLVFEEYWRERGAKVEDGQPELTKNEIQAILSGDPGHVNNVRIQRWLWRVAETGGSHDVTVDGDVWKLPTVVLEKCMKGAKKTATLGLHLVGKDFSKPYSAELANIATEFNLRLDARLTEEQQKSDVTWRLMWFKYLCGYTEINTANLNTWTRDMSYSGVHLLTEQAPRFMSALTWWPADAPPDSYDSDDSCGNVTDHTGRSKKKEHPRFERMLMVPRMISLSAMFKLSKLGTHPKRPKDPPPVQVYMFDNVDNPYKQLTDTGEQAVALANFSSSLGSAAHMSAANIVLTSNPGTPTAIENLRALNRFVASPDTTLGKIGMALYPRGDVAAVEFPVYWPTLALDNNFVGSRIDALTKNKNGSYDVWEFKTKWGLERPVPMPHIRQAVLYCYMFVMQTRCVVEKFHLRYVRIVRGQIEQTTYSYQFGEHLRPFLNQALARSGPWNHNRFTEACPPEKPYVFRANGVAGQKQRDKYAKHPKKPAVTKAKKAEWTMPPLEKDDEGERVEDDEGVLADEDVAAAAAPPRAAAAGAGAGAPPQEAAAPAGTDATPRGVTWDSQGDY